MQSDLLFQFLIHLLTENLLLVLKSRLASFAQSFSESNRATVKPAMKKAHHEIYCIYPLISHISEKKLAVTINIFKGLLFGGKRLCAKMLVPAFKPHP